MGEMGETYAVSICMKMNERRWLMKGMALVTWDGRAGKPNDKYLYGRLGFKRDERSLEDCEALLK
jgi:hypothetical protein